MIMRIFSFGFMFSPFFLCFIEIQSRFRGGLRAVLKSLGRVQFESAFLFVVWISVQYHGRCCSPSSGLMNVLRCYEIV